MQVVRADRWHKVSADDTSGNAGGRRCSVCNAECPPVHREAVLDGTTLRRYWIVRCAGCGCDLLEPLAS